MIIVVTVLLCPSAQPSGKTVLMKALLNLRDGDKTVEHLLAIAESKNDLHELVNAAHAASNYKGVNIGTVGNF